MSALPKRPPPPPIRKLPPPPVPTQQRPPFPTQKSPGLSLLKLETAEAPRQATIPAPQSRTPAPYLNKEEYALASIKKRVLATILDSFFMGIFSKFTSALLWTILKPSTAMAQIDPEAFNRIAEKKLGMIGIITAILSVVVIAAMIEQKGASPGKKLMKIRMIDADTHENLTFKTALKRETIGKFIGSFLFWGYLSALRDPRKQTYHDRSANSLVVDDNEV